MVFGYQNRLLGKSGMKNNFKDLEKFWVGKKVFITGHTGFKGSWLTLYLHHLGANITGYSLNPSTTPNLFDLANIEELIDSKPTARGQVLSRFMGLDFIKKKEDTGKEIYSEFSKSMLSNVYSSEKLKSDNDGYKERIEVLQTENHFVR